MAAHHNIDRIEEALRAYPWKKGGLQSFVGTEAFYNGMGMLLRQAGVSPEDIARLNVGTAWLRFGPILQGEFGLQDIADYYLIIAAGESAENVEDQIARVKRALNGDLEAVGPMYHDWVSRLIQNRDNLKQRFDQMSGSQTTFLTRSKIQSIELGRNLRERLVNSTLAWQQSFDLSPDITPSLAAYDAALLVGCPESVYSAYMVTRSLSPKSYDFVFSNKRYVVKSSHPVGRRALPVRRVPKPRNCTWDCFIWVSYNASYVLEEAWLWTVEEYQEQLSWRPRLTADDLRRGQRLK